MARKTGFQKWDVAALSKKALKEATDAGLSATDIQGLTIVDDNLKELWSRMGEAGYFKTWQIAFRILEESRNQVPYASGDLFGTGRINKLRDLQTGRFKTTEEGSFYVSYGGKSETGAWVDYAMIIHENPQGWEFNQDYKKHRWPARYPGPKKAEYLRDPAKAASRTMLGEVQKEVVTAVTKFMAEVAAHKATVAAPTMRPRLVKRTP